MCVYAAAPCHALLQMNTMRIGCCYVIANPQRACRQDIVAESTLMPDDLGTLV